MATRSSIAVELPSGHVVGVYCHWDGYPEHNGVLLNTYYNDYKAALELIAGGDMSYIDGVCGDIGYYALRGMWEPLRFGGKPDATGSEKWNTVKPSHYTSHKAFLAEMDQEYNYLFKDGKWHCFPSDY